jgi:O-acetylhomoserine/O-acetylserine sulfhydrylase-like pyridoxal-dependent enzyme
MGVNAREPALNTPDPSYHGAVWTEAVKRLGPIAYIALRMERHCANADAVAGSR